VTFKITKQHLLPHKISC